jgi:hypothetical protein
MTRISFDQLDGPTTVERAVRDLMQLFVADGLL